MSVALLEKGGFLRIGCWSSVPDCDHIALDTAIPKAPGVYAHVVDGRICYIGSAQRGLSRRMAHYARTTTMRTAYRIRQNILAALASGSIVEVYMLAASEEVLTFPGLPVDIVAGVEEGLIRALRPEWNRRGLGRIAA